MRNSTTHIEAAVADFARHEKGGGGWALGLEVAACVQPEGHGGNRRSSNGRNLKVNATEFARMAGTSAPRVLRYMEAWKRAAVQRIVASPDSLTPADWNDIDHLPVGYEWSAYFDASNAGGRPRDSRPEDAVRIIDRRGVEAVAGAMTRDQQVAMRDHLLTSLPDAPFSTPPVAYPGARSDETRMNVQRDIANLHDAIIRLERYAKVDPHQLRDHVERIVQERDLLDILVQVARGLTDADIAMLGGGGG